MSGVGKSTVARLVADRLTAMGRCPILLDGDRLRAIVPVPMGYEPRDRLRMARFYAQLTHELVTQGHLVLCATVSLFHEVHGWNRANIPGYLEVWMRAPIEELRGRAGKADFYPDPTTGRRALPHVVGVHTTAEFPRSSDLVIDNHGATTADLAADRIVEVLTARGAHPAER
ncbi:adenylyl-sulfate kinase [Streptomyces sp. NA02950]|nr:adenylyl-sulfate kinase [Streptomyces sp. NA02950]